MKNNKYLSLTVATMTIGIMALSIALSPLVYAEDGRIGTHIGAELNMGHRDSDNEGNKGMEDGHRALVGSITAISGSTITIATKGGPNGNHMTFTVNAANASIMKNNTSANLSNLAIGDLLVIKGAITGSSVVATNIRDNMPMKKGEKDQMNSLITGNGQPVVAGKVTAVSGSTITITNSSNVSYTVDATNAKIQKGNSLTAVSSVMVGDMIVVQGPVNNSSITASSVIDQGITSNSNENPNKDKEGKGKGFFGSIGAFFSHLFGF